MQQDAEKIWPGLWNVISNKVGEEMFRFLPAWLIQGSLAASLTCVLAPAGAESQGVEPSTSRGARIALIIGDGDYAHAGRLDNPTVDAQRMGELFTAAGFSTVDVKTDLDARSFRHALSDFQVLANDAEVAVIYFSGHGVESQGHNYLVPVDAALEREVDIQDETVSLDRVLDAVSPASKLKLVILDACRTDPFRTLGRTRATTRGLARVEPSDGNELVAYAARAGTVAQDGNSGDDSPYTRALLKNLMTPNLDVELALRRVRDEVLKTTHGAQEPFYYGSMSGEEFPLSLPREAVPESSNETQAKDPLRGASEHHLELENSTQSASKNKQPDQIDKPIASLQPVLPSTSTTNRLTTQSSGVGNSLSAAQVVRQRAALLVDAPTESQKVKTYVGTVVWRTDSMSPGSGQPLATAVRADVDVPEVALKLSVLFQKNAEPQFPASHTIELRFTPGAHNTLGNVKQINVPQMRQDDAPTGDPLTGLPVTVTENYFLVGLSRGDAVARNLDLMKTRNWFDVPLLLVSGKVAKITFEKGAVGEQVIEKALQDWAADTVSVLHSHEHDQ